MSVAFYGDYNTTETVYIPFNTFSSDDPSASVTITNLAAADVEIHKDGSTTQRASDNGVTVSIDFDSVTGNHLVAIDLSDNSDAGYYANGSRYQVRMEGTTVDGATINAWIGAFSIGCTLRPTTAGRTLDVETGGCAGIDWANVANPTTAVDLSATDIQLCDTVTTLTGHTAQTGDNYARLGAPAGASIAADIAAVKTNTGNIETDTQDLQTQVGTAGDGLTGIPWNAAWDAEVQSECTDALNAYDPPTKAELDSGLAGLNDISTSDVNAQVLDVFNTDTFAEPGQEAPPATTTLVKKIGYLYKFLRNKIDNDGSTIQVYADDTTTVDQKATVGESGGTVTRGEFGTGP